MQDYEKLGAFYIGKLFDAKKGELEEDNPLLLDSKDLTTHAICVGMTGSGKTGLGIAILEEAAIDGIPAIIIDPKGDLGDLLLTFPNLLPSDFLPWVDEGEAARKGLSQADYAAKVASTWKEGITSWGQNPERIRKLKESVDFSVYTPASSAGIPLAILKSFDAPPPDLIQDTEAYRDRILSTVSSLLGLLGIDADPIKSREHILISTILDKAWREQRNLDLPTLIRQVQTPPFDKIGVFDIDTYFPAKDRMTLSMHLNHLLSSPSFQAWMEGEPLNIQNLLYTKDYKPRHSILYIAHLSDNERMFFVTLLLNEIISWMRKQPGTSSLRALLYMDEIFGFFPPTAMPSSKIPMLTLLKQARAFGLGIVLCTQNPVDLDYKGLANCGIWFIGKLQTERDKARLLEGLKMTSSKDSKVENINDMLAACINRTFIMRSVYHPQPLLFQTRWTLSYLRGPLTLPQIQTLMQSKKIGNASTEVVQASIPKETISGASLADKPLIDSTIPEYFLLGQTPSKEIPFRPYILGIAKLHFVDAKNKIDTWQDRVYMAKPTENGKEVSWDMGQDITRLTSQLLKAPPKEASYVELPSELTQSKAYASFGKSLSGYIYQSVSLDLFSIPELKMTSKLDESEGAFRARLTQALREKRDEEVANLRQKYQSKIEALTEKVRKAQEKVNKEQSQVSQKKFDTAISIGATILGAIFGRRKLSSTTVSKAGTTIKQAQRIGKDQESAASAEENLKIYQQQLQELQNELQTQVMALLTQVDSSKMQVEKISVHPRKTDIVIDAVGLVWVQTL